MKPTFLKALLLSALLLLPMSYAAVASSPQDVLGTIDGRITDAAGKPVAGAAITVTSEETGLKREATSGVGGEFHVTLFPPGPCRVEVQKSGFGSYAQNLDV